MKLSKREKILNSELIMKKAYSLHKKYWGIEFFFDFVNFYSIRGKDQYKKLDLNSVEFQKFLEDQYSMFRLKKSSVFEKISKICFDVLSYQLGYQYNYLLGLSQHVAMAIIRNLNENVVSFNKMNANDVLSTFYQVYGSSQLIPINIHKILVDEKVLKLNDGFFSYFDYGVYSYFFLSSEDLMPIFPNSSTDIVFELDDFYIINMLNDLEKTDRLDISKFINYNEYSNLENLVDDWSNPEQYYKFEDPALDKFFFQHVEKKMLKNDKLFHSLLINQIGLGIYYYDYKIKRDNPYYYLNYRNEIES